MNEQNFSVRTDVFEGPLELLLDLIEKRKLLINDISLASVTDDYMSYVGRLEKHALPETAQFILVAATLLLIKSKSLLPVFDLTNEEEAKIEDLEHRLRLYQIYAHAGTSLQKQFGGTMLYSRPYTPSAKPLFKPDSFTTLDKLKTELRAVITRFPKKHVPEHEVAVKKTVSLENMMKQLEKRVTDQFKINFASFAGNTAERPDIIVSFLAVLELIKQGIVVAKQDTRYSDFDIEIENVDIPRYS